MKTLNLITFCFLLFALSCQQAPTFEVTPTLKVDAVKTIFNANKLSGSINKLSHSNTYNPIWDDAISVTNSFGTFLEVPFYKQKFVEKEFENEVLRDYRLIAYLKGDEVRFGLLTIAALPQFLAGKEYISQSVVNSQKKGDFTGLMYMQDMNGDVLWGHQFNDGQENGTVSYAVNAVASTLNKDGLEVSRYGGPGDGDGGTGDCRQEYTWISQERYCFYYNAGAPYCTPWEYTYGYVTVCDGGGGSGSYRESSSQSNDANKDNLDPCVKDVLDKIVDSGAGKIQNIINDFAGVGDKDYVWNVKSGECSGSQEVGCTAPTGTIIDGKIHTTTTIDRSQNSQSSDLYIASVLIHEMIHAHIVATYRDIGGGEYRDVVNKFVQMQGNATAAHHEAYIRNNLIPSATRTLMNYAVKQGYTDVDETYCKYLIWGGLMDTVAWQWVTESTKQKVRNAKAAEHRTKEYTTEKGNEAC